MHSFIIYSKKDIEDIIDCKINSNYLQPINIITSSTMLEDVGSDILKQLSSYFFKTFTKLKITYIINCNNHIGLTLQLMEGSNLKARLLFTDSQYLHIITNLSKKNNISLISSYDTTSFDMQDNSFDVRKKIENLFNSI